MLNRPPSFVNLNSFVSLMSLGHHNTNTSPNQTARRTGGVSLGSTERLQPHRCQRDHGSSEEEKERVSQLLAGTEKVRKLTLKHWREQRVSAVPPQEQCVPIVCSSNTAPALPSLGFLCALSCSAVMEVSRCRQEAAAAVWYEMQWSCDLSTPPPVPCLFQRCGASDPNLHSIQSEPKKQMGAGCVCVCLLRFWC